MVQTLAMLPLDHLAIIEVTERALATSPVLERADGHPCPGCGRHVSGGLCRRCRRGRPGDPPHPGVAAAEPSTDPFGTLEAEAGLVIRSDARSALPVVIASLTERGLLEESPTELAERHRLSPDAVVEAVRALRAVGPPGLAAPDVTALLVAQAEALVPLGRAPVWFPTFVRDHLWQAAQGDVEPATLALALPRATVEEAVRLARTLLRPFVAVRTADEPPARHADVIIHRDPDDGLVVEVPDSAWFGLRIADLASGPADTAEARAWLSGHEAAARRLLHQLDARADVLTRVTTVAVGHQRAFLEVGDAAHRPLTRTAVAAELGLHPSTVSRAVRGKTLRLPTGEIVELARLFGKGVAIRAVLRDLLADTDAPRSDARLREELSRRGLRVARRTVTAYRHSL